MASGKSLQLRNIVGPRGKLLHKSWERVLDRAGKPIGLRTFGPPYRNPDRPARKASTLAKRRAARGRKQAQERL